MYIFVWNEFFESVDYGNSSKAALKINAAFSFDFA